MSRTPEELRQVARQCRELASTCITEQARRPLWEVADDLEQEALKQEALRRAVVSLGRC